jgi:hypothetical protein
MIGARASPRCELCRRERRHEQAAIEHLPEETVAHIQSTGCIAQKKSVIRAHNRCWKYLLCAITKHVTGRRSVTSNSLGKTKLESLWKETNRSYGEAKRNFEFVEEKVFQGLGNFE